MISSALASFIKNLQGKEIPPHIIEKAKYCLIDYLGVTIRGSREKSSQVASRLINSIKNSDKDSSGLVTIWGHGKGELMEACFINGISAHALDLDDGHALAQLHPGGAVITSALAVAEYHDKTGQELLEAIITGYEVEIALGILLNPQHRNQGFHSTGTLGVFGSTAAAAKLLDLNQEQIINALGLAGSQSCGLLESDHAGTMAKHLHAGHAAQSGVRSVLMAQNGFTGASSIFEGREGFINSMCNLNIDFSKLESDLNSLLGQFHIKDVYFKKYPVCRHLHSAIDSALHIFNEFKKKQINIDQIENIKVHTYKIAAEHDNNYPQTSAATRQSLPVSVAIALTKGDIKLEDVKAYDQLSPEIRELTHKIKVEFDKNLDNFQPYQRPSRIKIVYHSRFNKKIPLQRFNMDISTHNPAGEIDNPLSKKEIKHKFQVLNPQLKDLNWEILNEMDTEKMGSILNNLNL